MMSSLMPSVARCGAGVGAVVGGYCGLFVKEPRKTHDNAPALIKVACFGASKLTFLATGVVYGAGAGVFLGPPVFILIPLGCIAGLPEETVLYPLRWVAHAWTKFIEF
jgi:hypothetical protein